MQIALFWHLHQPLYRDPESGLYVLPWVNFHAVKNYHQMVRLAEEQEFPCTFNLVPCLLEQIEDYVRGTAADPFQEALEVEPESLSDRQAERLRKILPGRQDKRDLQMQALRFFFSPLTPTDGDRETLLDRRLTILRNLIPDFSRLWQKGVIDITTTPYYHPLLPLVIDQTCAQEERLPAQPYRYPEDGSAQVEKGTAYFEKVFGRSPAGMWPAEGGISRDAAGTMADSGIPFALTDEDILWKSLPLPHRRQDLFRSYQAGNLGLFFRDRELSDLIGFEYQKWNEKEAVSHFLSKIQQRREVEPDEDAVLTVALDGENPWAGYRDNGVPFLRELYSRLKMEEGVKPVMFTDYLSRRPRRRELDPAAGTWLGGFSKWMGSPAKNKYWDLLSRARRDCGPREEILVAEGSDWFWWAGEEDDPEFGRLFRAWIKKAYASAGVEMPE